MNSSDIQKNGGLKRLLLLIMAVCLVLASVLSAGIKAEQAEGFSSGASSEDYRKWAQGDQRWGSLPMGTSGKTVAKIGCLVTSVTKLIIQSGFRESDSFNVATLVTWLNANGGISSVGNLIWEKPAQMIDGLSFYGMDYTVGSSGSAHIQNRILDYVREGRHVVLEVKNGGHWVAVDRARSLDAGKVYIMDSLNNVSGNADVLLSSRYSTISRICMYTGSAGSPAPSPTPVVTPEPQYADGCETEPVSMLCRVKVDSANIYTQPCAAGNGTSVSTSAPRDSILEISAQIVNTYGESWYRVEDGAGLSGYVDGQSIEFAGFVNDLEIVTLAPPSGSLTLGNGYPLTETIISNHTLTSVTGRITDENGSSVLSVTLHPNTRGEFDIESTAINSDIRFGTLAAGHYTYELTAEVTADCNLTSEIRVFRSVFTSPFSIGVAALETHNVVFFDPIADETVAVQTVAHGFYPVLIDGPEHEGMSFVSWSGGGRRIYDDTTLNAVFAFNGTVGDVDGNGVVNISDALMIMRCAMGIGSVELPLAIADVDGDGAVTVADAITVLRAVIG